MTLNGTTNHKFLPGDRVEIIADSTGAFDDKIGARGVVMAEPEAEAGNAVVAVGGMLGRWSIPEADLAKVAK